jgi:hypothetical protein
MYIILFLVVSGEGFMFSQLNDYFFTAARLENTSLTQMTIGVRVSSKAMSFLRTLFQCSSLPSLQKLHVHIYKCSIRPVTYFFPFGKDYSDHVEVQPVLSADIAARLTSLVIQLHGLKRFHNWSAFLKSFGQANEKGVLTLQTEDVELVD